jgi:hypothetical protein
MFAKADEDTARSAAGRAALESVVFAAPSVLPQRGVARRAESDERLVARFDLPPERPEKAVGSWGWPHLRSAVNRTTTHGVAPSSGPRLGGTLNP